MRVVFHSSALICFGFSARSAARWSNSGCFREAMNQPISEGVTPRWVRLSVISSIASRTGSQPGLAKSKLASVAAVWLDRASAVRRSRLWRSVSFAETRSVRLTPSLAWAFIQAERIFSNSSCRRDAVVVVSLAISCLACPDMSLTVYGPSRRRMQRGSRKCSRNNPLGRRLTGGRQEFSSCRAGMRRRCAAGPVGPARDDRIGVRRTWWRRRRSGSPSR